MAYCIEEGTPAQWDEVAKGLFTFNQRKAGVCLAPPKPYTQVALDDNKNVIGGILCTWHDVLGNLSLDILWVDEKHRGTGIGAALLRAAENFARQHACILCTLETLDFQAKDFYAKQGYAVFGTLEGPPGHRRYFMQKRL